MALVPFNALLVGQLRKMLEALEIGFTRCAGREQNQELSSVVSFIAEAVDAPGRDEEEVALFRINPFVAVVQPHAAGQDVERLRDSFVVVRGGPGSTWPQFDAVQAVITR